MQIVPPFVGNTCLRFLGWTVKSPVNTQRRTPSPSMSEQAQFASSEVVTDQMQAGLGKDENPEESGGEEMEVIHPVIIFPEESGDEEEVIHPMIIQ